MSNNRRKAALRGRLHPRRFQGGVEGATQAPMMKFAVEAQKLLGVSLEGAVG